MALQSQTRVVRPGDILLVIHDFTARSGDELNLTRGDKIELIERDDDFGDGWFLGKHLLKDETGLFPEVYTTPAPKTRQVASVEKRLATQPGQKLSKGITGFADTSTHESATAPPVQPFASDRSSEMDAMSRHSVQSFLPTDRSVSAPLAYSSLPNTSPSSTSVRRAPPSTVAQRSISLSNGPHQNSPVMNETLSVIDEHITDMSTPRHSLLMPEQRNGVGSRDGDLHIDPTRRLSYINGQETDEEESGMLSEQEVRSWTPDRVAEYLEDLGAEEQHCVVFKEQEISGDVLLGMDQGSLMLKEFELGPIGRRLALWQKVKAIQEEVRISRTVPRYSSDQSLQEGSLEETTRNRSTSVGLPRIPSLAESSSGRAPSRQQSQRSSTRQFANRPDSLASLPAVAGSDRMGHEHRPSAASVRSLHTLNHNRQRSSIDPANPSSDLNLESPGPSSQISHGKSGSFDRSWTMGENSKSPTEMEVPSRMGAGSPVVDADFASFPHEVGLTIVSSIDLDRGYFSGNEADSRRSRNVLRRKGSASPTAHGRSPSDSHSTRRLSGILRHHKTGSTDSLMDSAKGANLSAAQIYYGSAGSRSGPRHASGPQIGNSRRHPASLTPPTVTKLDYLQSPSIDAIASASPNLFYSGTPSIDRSMPSPAPVGRMPLPKSRVTGLRAISDAITGSEKAMLSPRLEQSLIPVKDSPLQSPSSMQSPSRTDSSTPSVTSKSVDMDDSSLLKNDANSSGGALPILSSAPRPRGKKSTSAYLRGLEHKSPQQQMEVCDYSGWMKKKSSNLMTTWKTRLFVLKGRRLSYYYSEGDTEEKGLIDISFHRVLPANNDRITGLHAQVTRATSSPTSPQNALIPTAASTDVQRLPGDAPGMFIFKLVPPRPGLSKAVNFTKPTVHYFAVDNIQQGRLWMAALMKATIDRDDRGQVITTYKEKTVSLARAKAMRQRPPALMGDDEIILPQGLAIDYSNNAPDLTTSEEREGSLTTAGTANTGSSENLEGPSTEIAEM